MLLETLVDIARDLLATALGSISTGCAFALGGAFITRRLYLLSLRMPSAVSKEDAEEEEEADTASKEDVPHLELSMLFIIALLTVCLQEPPPFDRIHP